MCVCACVCSMADTVYIIKLLDISQGVVDRIPTNTSDIIRKVLWEKHSVLAWILHACLG